MNYRQPLCCNVINISWRQLQYIRAHCTIQSVGEVLIVNAKKKRAGWVGAWGLRKITHDKYQRVISKTLLGVRKLQFQNSTLSLVIFLEGPPVVQGYSLWSWSSKGLGSTLPPSILCPSECSLRVPGLNHLVCSLAAVHSNIVQYRPADGKRYANAISSSNIVNKSVPSCGTFPATTWGNISTFPVGKAPMFLSIYLHFLLWTLWAHRHPATLLMTNCAKTSAVIWLDQTISTVFYDVTSHLLNKWKAKKESCGGWLFRGAVIALPALRCPRAVICRQIEMRLAGQAKSRAWFTHTVKSHRQLAAASVRRPASDTHIYLLPPKSEPYGFCQTRSRPQTAGWKCWMLREWGEGTR